MSAQVPRYVIDASVAIKWLFDDEDHVAEARNALLMFQQERIDVVVPDHLRHEVINAIRTAVRMNRVDVQDARVTARAFIALGLPIADGPGLCESGFEHALHYGCAYYDGVYLALAAQVGCPLVHADRRLRNTLRGRFRWELWIEDFS